MNLIFEFSGMRVQEGVERGDHLAVREDGEKD